MKLVFTKHAQEQMQKRNIFVEDVVEALKYPLQTRKKHGLLFLTYNTGRGNIEICAQRSTRHIKIITVYWL